MKEGKLKETEAKIAGLWNAGELPSLVHLSGGNERELVEIFQNIDSEDWVFCSHRAHYHWLLHHSAEHGYFSPPILNKDGVPVYHWNEKTPAEMLVEKVKAGKSMFLYGHRFIQSAIVAGVCAMAAGLALSIKRRGGAECVWCFIGDAGAHEGAFYEAVRFVNDRDLPCRFVIEDNNSSCGVTQAERGEKPWPWPACVATYRYTPTWPHAGTGEKMTLKWKP